MEFKSEEEKREECATIEREQKVIEFSTKIGILILKAIKEILLLLAHTQKSQRKKRVSVSHTHTHTLTNTHIHTLSNRFHAKRMHIKEHTRKNYRNKVT